VWDGESGESVERGESSLEELEESGEGWRQAER